MARKPRAKTATRPRPRLGAAQSARYAAYKKKHGIKGELTVEQRRRARGHKPAEHVTRKPRGALSEKQAAIVRRYAVRQSKRKLGADPDDYKRRMVAWAEEKGFAVFLKMRELRDSLTPSRYAVRKRKGRLYISGSLKANMDNVAAMEAFAAQYDVPDIAWMYYTPK